MITLGDRKGNLGVQIATMGSVLLVYYTPKVQRIQVPILYYLDFRGFSPERSASFRPRATRQLRG